VRATVLLSLGVFFGCAGSPPEPVVPPSAPPKPVAAPAPAAPLTTLRRPDVIGMVESGFGSFLQRVQVEPSLLAGRFRGWTIVDLRPSGFWEPVDLKPGDVVTSVNGLPIERDTEAYAAFESLRTADQLKVDYFRDGAPRSLAYPIVD
jgi:general secretion pathway protein C